MPRTRSKKRSRRSPRFGSTLVVGAAAGAVAGAGAGVLAGAVTTRRERRGTLPASNHASTRGGSTGAAGEGTILLHAATLETSDLGEIKIGTVSSRDHSYRPLHGDSVNYVVRSVFLRTTRPYELLVKDDQGEVAFRTTDVKAIHSALMDRALPKGVWTVQYDPTHAHALRDFKKALDGMVQQRKEADVREGTDFPW